MKNSGPMMSFVPDPNNTYINADIHLGDNTIVTGKPNAFNYSAKEEDPNLIQFLSTETTAFCQ
jgi:di/tripeptidase